MDNYKYVRASFACGIHNVETELRKYVSFTWGRGLIPFEDGAFVEMACCNCFTVPKGGSPFNQRKQIRTDNISFNNKVSKPNDKVLQDVKYEEGKNENSNILSNNADTAAADIPLPPSLEIRPGSETSIQEIQENLKNLYEYNVRLREKLVSTRSRIHDLASNASTSSSDHRHQ